MKKASALFYLICLFSSQAKLTKRQFPIFIQNSITKLAQAGGGYDILSSDNTFVLGEELVPVAEPAFQAILKKPQVAVPVDTNIVYPANNIPSNGSSVTPSPSSATISNTLINQIKNQIPKETNPIPPVKPIIDPLPPVKPIVNPIPPVVNPIPPVIPVINPIPPVVNPSPPVKPIVNPLPPVVNPIPPVVNPIPPVKPIVNPIPPVVNPIPPVVNPIPPVKPVVNPPVVNPIPRVDEPLPPLINNKPCNSKCDPSWNQWTISLE